MNCGRTLIEMRGWHSKQAFAQFSNLGIRPVGKLSSPGVPGAKKSGVERLHVCKSPIICSEKRQ